MTWKRLHCIVCHSDMESCAICGCHDDVPVASNLDGTCSDRMNDEPKRKAPAANGGRLTRTEEESK